MSEVFEEIGVVGVMVMEVGVRGVERHCLWYLSLRLLFGVKI
jgi:hypothetical protein